MPRHLVLHVAAEERLHVVEDYAVRAADRLYQCIDKSLPGFGIERRQVRKVLPVEAVEPRWHAAVSPGSVGKPFLRQPSAHLAVDVKHPARLATTAPVQKIAAVSDGERQGDKHIGFADPGRTDQLDAAGGRQQLAQQKIGLRDIAGEPMRAREQIYLENDLLLMLSAITCGGRVPLLGFLSIDISDEARDVVAALLPALVAVGREDLIK